MAWATRGSTATSQFAAIASSRLAARRPARRSARLMPRICGATGWSAGQAWIAHESGGFLVAMPVFHCSSDLFHAFRASNGVAACADDRDLLAHEILARPGDPKYEEVAAVFEPLRKMQTRTPLGDDSPVSSGV